MNDCKSVGTVGRESAGRATIRRYVWALRRAASPCPVRPARPHWPLPPSLAGRSTQR